MEKGGGGEEKGRELIASSIFNFCNGPARLEFF